MIYLATPYSSPDHAVMESRFKQACEIAARLKNNGCKAIGIELNPEYIEIAKRRLAQDVLEFSIA